jgi:hypothetical protein
MKILLLLFVCFVVACGRPFFIHQKKKEQKWIYPEVISEPTIISLPLTADTTPLPKKYEFQNVIQWPYVLRITTERVMIIEPQQQQIDYIIVGGNEYKIERNANGATNLVRVFKTP